MVPKWGIAAVVAIAAVVVGVLLQQLSVGPVDSGTQIVAQGSTPASTAEPMASPSSPADAATIRAKRATATDVATVPTPLATAILKSESRNTPLPSPPPRTPTRGPEKTATPGALPTVTVPVTLTNDEGEVTIKVTWQGRAAGPVFVVTMDTHSVPLDGYDLGALSSLTTDKGVVVSPMEWLAPRGGHHRKGTLAFPQTADSGEQVLEPGTKYIELTIRDVGEVAGRTFRWEV